MRTIPILFSTAMVQAILEGRKTQTRRIIKGNPKEIKEELVIATLSHQYYADGKEIEPPYKPGNILWVRETWAAANDIHGEFHHYNYNADNDPFHVSVKWKPSIHMPKEACRLFLKVISVRVQYLQSITEADAIAEGIEDIYDKIDVMETCYRNYMHGKDEVTGKNLPKEKVSGWDVIADDAIHSFKTLWQSVYGLERWDANPFVWVVEFERIDKPANWPNI